MGVLRKLGGKCWYICSFFNLYDIMYIFYNCFLDCVLGRNVFIFFISLNGNNSCRFISIFKI